MLTAHFSLYRKFVFRFCPSEFRGLAHEPDIPTTVPTFFCHTNGPLRWLPSRLMDHYFLLLLRRPQQQQ